MSKLNILEYPDPRLRTRAKKVEKVDEKLRQLIDDMFETMYAAPGIGLAATQVNVHQRVLVADISDDQSQPVVLINPEIIAADDEGMTEEGCLSVPGIYEPVRRFQHVRVRSLDRDGNETEVEAHGLLAVCIQHEMDHLEGKLFVDYLSELKRQRIRKKIEKGRRDTVVSRSGASGTPSII